MKPVRMLSLALAASAAMLLFQSVAFAIGTAYSGAWYNPEQDGHGFSLEYTILNDGSPLVVAYWYVYDSEGNPIFLVGVGEPEEGNTVTLDFDAPYGMKFGEFDPEQLVHGDGGTGVFTFQNPESGTFVYEPSDWISSRYGISAITSDMVKLIDVEHPNPEVIELQVERKGPQGPKGDVGPAGPQGPKGPAGTLEVSPAWMENGNGQIIGAIVGYDYETNLASMITQDGYLFETSFTLDNVRPGGPGSIPIYTDPNCNGQPYMNREGSSRDGMLVTDGDKLYVFEWGAISENVEPFYTGISAATCRLGRGAGTGVPVRVVLPADYGLELQVDGTLAFPQPLKPAVAR